MNKFIITKSINCIIGFICFVMTLKSIHKAYGLKEDGKIRDYIQQEFNTFFYMLLTLFIFS